MSIPIINSNGTVTLTLSMNDYKDIIFCVETVNNKRDYQQQYYQKHKTTPNYNNGRKIKTKINMNCLLLQNEINK